MKYVFYFGKYKHEKHSNLKKILMMSIEMYGWKKR